MQPKKTPVIVVKKRRVLVMPENPVVNEKPQEVQKSAVNILKIHGKRGYPYRIPPLQRRLMPEPHHPQKGGLSPASGLLLTVGFVSQTCRNLPVSVFQPDLAQTIPGQIREY